MKALAITLVVALLVALGTVRAQSQLCQVCQLVVATAENFLEENSTEQEVEDVLETVCNNSIVKRMGYSEQCDALVEAYLPELIQLLVQKETPQVACAQLKLCSGKPQSLASAPLPKRQMAVKQIQKALAEKKAAKAVNVL